MEKNHFAIVFYLAKLQHRKTTKEKKNPLA